MIARLTGLERSSLPSPRRAFRMYQRNLLVYKHSWMVILSGFFEPLFYMLSLGLGLGSMVNGVNGVSYAAFVAPGLLASSCMNGAVTDGFFNIWFKLHYQKTYNSILSTPMRAADIVLGELLWSLSRGSLYAVTFILLMFGLGHLRGEPILLARTALLALPAALFTAASFSSMALCLTTFVRNRTGMDMALGLIVMPMFLFSGIFFPVAQLPMPLQWFLQVVPLYHGVELLRALTTGMVTPVLAWHFGWLLTTGLVAITVAMARLERALIK
ncbi:MAG: ABC transporter permease [Vicinamibacterales bacterium]